MKLPIPNTPGIMESKKKRIKKLWLWTRILCCGFLFLFLISIHMDPPAPFLASILCLAAPFVILFIAAMQHFHIKLFPEFDYGKLTPKQIQAHPVSQKFYDECRRIQKRKVIKFLIIVVLTFIGVSPAAMGNPEKGQTLYILRQVLYSMEFLPMLGVLLTARLLSKDVALRLQLELVKYTLK